MSSAYPGFESIYSFGEFSQIGRYLMSGVVVKECPALYTTAQKLFKDIAAATEVVLV